MNGLIFEYKMADKKWPNEKPVDFRGWFETEARFRVFKQSEENRGKIVTGETIVQRDVPKPILD